MAPASFATASVVSDDIGNPPPVLVAGGYSAEVYFIDTYSGEIRRKLDLHDWGCSHINCLSVSSSSGTRDIAVAGHAQLRLYDTSGRPVREYVGHTGNVTAAQFDNTGRFLASASEDGSVKLWDKRTKQCSTYLQGSDIIDRPAVHSAAYHPNQQDIIAGDAYGQVVVWDLTASAIRQKMIPVEGVPIRSVAVSPDSKYLVAATHEGSAYVWDSEYKPTQSLDGHNTFILRCAFSPDSRTLAMASADQTVSLWSLTPEAEGRQSASHLHSPQPHQHHQQHLPQQQHQQQQQQQEQQTRQKWVYDGSLRGHQKWVWDVTFSGDGTKIFTGSSDCTCCWWDVDTKEVHRTYNDVHRGFCAIALIEGRHVERAPLMP